ncbi:MAG: hypothetical protein ROR55_24250 [Devosia sp.]
MRETHGRAETKKRCNQGACRVCAVIVDGECTKPRIRSGLG